MELSIEHIHFYKSIFQGRQDVYATRWEKNITALKNKLKLIDVEIGKIRTNGRQQYLENQMDKFSRIVHDYSNERKGFIIWKELLEEKLL